MSPNKKIDFSISNFAATSLYKSSNLTDASGRKRASFITFCQARLDLCLYLRPDTINLAGKLGLGNIVRIRFCLQLSMNFVLFMFFVTGFYLFIYVFNLLQTNTSEWWT